MEKEKDVFSQTGWPFPPTGSGPDNGAEAPQPPPPDTPPHEPDPDEKGKCKKCGFWHNLGQSIGEAIGDAKFGQ